LIGGLLGGVVTVLKESLPLLFALLLAPNDGLAVGLGAFVLKVLLRLDCASKTGLALT